MSNNINDLTKLVKRYCNLKQINDLVEASEHGLYYCIYLPRKNTIIETIPCGSSNMVIVKNGVDYQVLQSGDYQFFTGYSSTWHN